MYVIIVVKANVRFIVYGNSIMAEDPAKRKIDNKEMKIKYEALIELENGASNKSVVWNHWKYIANIEKE